MSGKTNNQSDRTNRRQPLRFREQAGEARLIGIMAAEAHPVRSVRRLCFWFRLSVALSLATFVGCSTPTTGEQNRSFSFAVNQLKGRARCSSGDRTAWHALRAGDKLRAGWWVQTPADLGCYMDLSLRRSITVRVHPDSLVRIRDVTRGSDGVGDRAELELRIGKICVGAKHTAICGVAFTNGIVRICDGLVCVSERGQVDALKGSAFVLVTGQSEPTKVPQGYRFDPSSGKIYDLTFFH